MGSPAGFEALFDRSYVDYANADVVGTFDDPPPELVHRIHLVATPEPGIVTVCASIEGWRFLPGGRLEPGEGFESAASRELYEEAGSARTGPLRIFFSHVAHSRNDAPYLPHCDPHCKGVRKILSVDVETATSAPSPGYLRPQWIAPTKGTTMPKYLMLKHYRGAPQGTHDVPMDKWTRDEFDAHIKYMSDFADRLEAAGQLVDENALAQTGMWVRYDGEDKPPVTDGPFAETKDLIAGWMIIDVESEERAIELAGELSAAPGAGGRPIGEWLELRPLMTAETAPTFE